MIIIVVASLVIGALIGVPVIALCVAGIVSVFASLIERAR